MCEFCEKEKTIFELETISRCSWGWGGDMKIPESEVITARTGVFIDDRGYLRMVDLDDCNCLDSGQKIRIQFCPFCGNKVKEG